MKPAPCLYAIAFSALCVSASNAGAASAGHSYAGIQYAYSAYQEDGFEDINPSAVVARLGKYINNNFSLEGRLGFGLQDDSIEVSGIDVSLEIDTMFGIYGVGHLNLNASSSIYGLFGITRGEATASAIGFAESSKESGLSYGVGADLGVGDNASLNIEYVQYLHESDVELSAIGIGVRFLF